MPIATSSVTEHHLVASGCSDPPPSAGPWTPGTVIAMPDAARGMPYEAWYEGAGFAEGPSSPIILSTDKDRTTYVQILRLRVDG